MRILIIGGTGYIGRHLAAFWQGSKHHVTILSRKVDPSLFDKSTRMIEADITQKEDIQAAIIFIQPDVVIHCAAMSKPNDCEVNKEQCYLTNVTATNDITQACKAIGSKLIFLSTDFVFGDQGPYREEDSYDPVNYYGESKVLAEKIIKEAGVSYAIVRTVLVYGSKLAGQANTFLHWVKENVEHGKSIRVYTDQQRSATYVNDLCKGINAILERNFEGVVHLGGEEVITPFSLAKEVAYYLELDTQLVQPITRNEQPEIAVRPENAVLKIDKAKQELHYNVTPVRMAIQEIFPVSHSHST